MPVRTSLSRFRFLIAVAGGLACTAAIAIGLTIWWLRSEAISEASRDAGGLATVLAEQTNRSVQSIDLLLNEVHDRIDQLGVTTQNDFRRLLQGEDTYQLLMERMTRLSHIATISLVDNHGVIVNSTNQWPMPPTDISDREHFQYVKKNNIQGIYISRPITDRFKGIQTIFFYKRVNDTNDEFLGIISIGVRLSYFQHIYESIKSLHDMSFLFLRKDGTVLVRYPDPKDRAGETLPAVSPWYRLVSQGGGEYRSPGYFDGIARQVAVRVLRDYPLVVNVAASETAALATWRTQAIIIGIGTLLVMLCLAFLLRALGNQFRYLAASKFALVEKTSELERANAKVDAALNNMSQGLAMFDSSARLTVCNDRYLQISKLSPELTKPGCSVLDLLRHRFANGTFTGNPEVFADNLIKEIAKGRALRTIVETNDGRTIAVVNQPMPDGGWVATHDDVTETIRVEKEREQQKLQLDAALENMSQGLCMFDAKQRLTVCNKRYAELYGLNAEQTKPGTTLRTILDHRIARGNAPDDHESYINDRIKEVTENRPYQTTNKLSDGRYISVVHQPVADGGWVATHADVTDWKRAERRIAHMAHFDMLTELPNRTSFNDAMDAALDRARTRSEQFAVLSIDLDRFKEANDTYGHLVGDELLREGARRLQAAAKGAFVARIGGDEFVVISEVGAQQATATATAVAERLLAAFVDDFEVEGHRLKLGMSIGAAVYPADGTDAKTLLINADAALYRAKAEMRGAAMFYEPKMGDTARERRALQEDLRSAIDRDELLLYYQPQLKISGETIGFEALVRWQCPKRGMVLPGTFIPIAEESSLIISVGEWVLREACREAASWPRPLTIAVNISPIQFRQGDLPRLVHSVLLETGLTPSRLELEITESVMIHDFSRALSILNRLKSLGVKIAMDDFGTGYSSLSYLQSFRCDKIKIDRVFICDLESNHHSRAIVRAVIGLGRSLKLPILAEGVETDAQYTYLRNEGCDEVQGYLTGRPLSITDYADLVGRKSAAQQNHAVTG